MFNRLSRLALLVSLSALGAIPAFAQSGMTCSTIDFESIPGVSSSDFLVVDAQFESSLGITFALEDGTAPQLAEVGSPTSAFEPNDQPDGDQGIGTFFLTDDGILTSTAEPSPLIVSFSTPADSASGVVLDIDGNETFTIQARDAAGALLEEIVITAGDPGTGDGVATPWGFRRQTADVASIRFLGVRPSGRFGLGFDNFTTCAPGRSIRVEECVLLDFESIPGSVPSEGLVIDTQFEPSLGMTFALEDGTAPHLAAVGEPTTAFEPNDRPDEGQGTGTFFLTDDGVLASTSAPPPLIVSFSTPVDSASGVVLDIDFSETFTIQARDGSGNVLEEVVISAGDEGTGDGKATPWAFKRAAADVASIRFVGFRSSGRFGLGFDNFTTCAPGRVTSASETLPRDVSLLRAYPNPFQRATRIAYSLTYPSRVRLDVFTALGRRVAVLVERVEAAGDHEVVWTPATLPSGVYFYRLQTEAGIATGRLLHIR